jgi:iron complex outermembrane receptor protein
MRLALASQHEAYGQFSISEKDQRTVIQPVPISDQFALPANHPLFNVAPFNGSSTFLLRPSSPYYPTAFIKSQTVGGTTPDVLVRYRSEGTGNRDLSDISLFTRAVVGLKGTVQAWDYDAAAFHIQTNLRERVNGGFPALSRILPLLDSGQVNPFGPNTPAVQAQLDATQFHGDAWKTKTSLDGASAKVSHDLMKMPGGSLALALGLEGRREGFKLTPSPEIQSGDISGFGGNFLPIDKARNVGSAFTELNVPVFRTLEATGAVRYDNYQGTGDKTSPKLGLRWQPMRQALFRGSWGKGFRAPSLTELYQPQVIGVTANGVTDPARCPTTTSSNDCQTQFPITVGGSATLKPEVSTNRSIGMILEPVNNFSIGVDYWEVDLTNTIIFGIAPQAILNDPAKFPGLVTRAAPDPTCPGCPGQVIDINQVNTNLGETKIKGFDTNLLYRIPAAALGTFTASMNGTYFYKYSLQNPDGTFTSVNGMVGPTTQGVGGVIPRWRHYLALNWRLAPWDVTFAQQYQSHYRDMLGTLEDPTDPTCVCHRTVGEYSLYHLYASYTGLFDKNLRVTLGLRNMFDRKPPYSNAGGQNFFQAGYDPGYADPRGRTFLISGTYKFK